MRETPTPPGMGQEQRPSIPAVAFEKGNVEQMVRAGELVDAGIEALVNDGHFLLPTEDKFLGSPTYWKLLADALGKTLAEGANSPAMASGFEQKLRLVQERGGESGMTKQHVETFQRRVDLEWKATNMQ